MVEYLVSAAGKFKIVEDGKVFKGEVFIRGGRETGICSCGKADCEHIKFAIQKFKEFNLSIPVLEVV